MRLIPGVVAAFAVLAPVAAPAQATQLRPETVSAFNNYIKKAEPQMKAHLRKAGYLWLDQLPERRELARKGEIPVDSWGREGDLKVPGGLIHDWVGAIFIHGVTLKQTLDFVQDYDHQKDRYQPEVIDSKLLARNGSEFKVYLRVIKKKVITVVLDTEHDARYFPLDGSRCYAQSYSTRIVEVRDPGKPSESKLPVGQDHGFLWRLYSYWHFHESDGGVYVELRAVSLTRDVPAALSWLITPIIRHLPKESLAATLAHTRDGLTR